MSSPPTGFVLDEPKGGPPPGFVIDEQTTAVVVEEPIVDEPRTKSEATWLDMIQRSTAETGLRGDKQIGEGIISIAGRLGTMAVSGLAGGLAAIYGSGRGGSKTATEVVEDVQQAGAEFFAPKTAGGQAVAEVVGEGLGEAVEAAGTAIKYPLSAVPFFVGGTEEREKFMEMPMSQYLGELAQDNNASPLFSTLAHMIPDTALTLAGLGGSSKLGLGVSSKAKNIKAATPKPKISIPTIEELKAQSTALYDIVDNAGIRISDEAFSAAVDSIMANVRSSGARRSLAPKTWKALDELAADAKAGGITLKQAEELRRVLKKAHGGIDADTASASRAIRAYDRFMEGLTEQQLTGPSGQRLTGAAAKEAVEFLKSARSLWSRARKTEQIEDLIAVARKKAGTYSGSGYENALRAQFRALSINKKKMKMFTAAEQKVIQAVADGTPYANIMKNIGKAAPTGVVSAALGSGIGFTVAGPLGAVAVPAVGTGARMLATQATKKAAQKARDTMAQKAP